MKYTLISMRPIDDFDCVIEIQATPARWEEMLGRKKRVLRYYGSGITWRKGTHGRHCGFFTSEWLHRIWIEESKRLEDAKKAAQARSAARAAEAASQAP